MTSSSRLRRLVSMILPSNAHVPCNPDIRLSKDIGRRSLTETPGALSTILHTLEAYEKKKNSGESPMTRKNHEIVNRLVKTLSTFPPHAPQKRINRLKISNLLSLTHSIDSKDRGTIILNIACGVYKFACCQIVER